MFLRSLKSFGGERVMNPEGKNKRRLDVKPRAEHHGAVGSSRGGPLRSGGGKAGVSSGEVSFRIEVLEGGV